MHRWPKYSISSRTIGRLQRIADPTVLNNCISAGGLPRVLEVLEKDTEKLDLCVDALERDVVHAPEGNIGYLSAIFAAGRLANEGSLLLGRMKKPAACALTSAKKQDDKELLDRCKEIVKLGETARENVRSVIKVIRDEFELPERLDPVVIIEKINSLVQMAKAGPHCDEWGCTTCGGPLGGLLELVDMRTVVECTMLVEQLSADELETYIPNREIHYALAYILPVKLKLTR